MSSSARSSPRRSAVATALAAGQGLWQGTLDRHGPRRLAAIGLVLALIASPWPPLTIVALAAYALLTLRQPGLTVALLPLSAPFAYLPKTLVLGRTLSLPVAELLLLLALATTGLHVAAGAWRGLRSGSVAAVIRAARAGAAGALGEGFGPHAATLAILGAFSLLTVADPGHLRESLREYRTIVLEPVLYFFLARHWLRARDLRDLAAGSLVAGAALAAALGVGQVLSGVNVVVADGARRAVGPYPHPNALALYLVRALPFALATLALASGPRRAHPRPLLLLLAVPPLGLGLLLTFSRGAFAGLAVALIVLAIVAERRAVRLGLLGLVLLGVLLLPALAGTRLDSLAAGGGSVGLRLLIWQSTVAMLRDHPAFGVGLDQFYYQYAPRYIQPEGWAERYTAHPHNLLLDFWVRLGIMGLAWLGWLLGALGARLVRGWQEATAPGDRRLLVAAGVACGAALVHGSIDNFYFLIDLAFLWWLLLALIQLSSDREAEARTAD